MLRAEDEGAPGHHGESFADGREGAVQRESMAGVVEAGDELHQEPVVAGLAVGDSRT